VNPADVDTPMYAEEMKNKPLACRRISEGLSRFVFSLSLSLFLSHTHIDEFYKGSGVLAPDVVADDVIASIKNWRFMVNTGTQGKIYL
jgi:hypothetical protein